MIQDNIINHLESRIEYLNKEINRLISLYKDSVEETYQIKDLESTKQALQITLDDFKEHLKEVNQWNYSQNTL